MVYDDNPLPKAKQEPKMNWGPDWNWIGYMNSFDDESGNDGGGGGCGCLSVLIIIGVTVVLLALLGK
jgi:hypothetical protein